MSDKDQKQSSVQTEPSVDIHDRVAEAYYGLMGQQFMRETQARIHWICRQIQGKNVLDVGCSQGIVPILLAREGVHTIGLDSSPKAIEQATKYLESEPKQVRKHVLFVNADFLSWDHHDVKVDTVVMSEVLEHLTRPDSFVETAARILPKKGRLIVTVPFGINDFIDHKHTFYLLEPLRLISKHFDVAEIEILGKWLGIVADRRTAANSRKEPFQPTIAVMEKLEGAFDKTERVLRDELTAIRKKLEEANQKYRGVTDQISMLKQRVTDEEKTRRVAEQAALQQQVAQLSKQEQAHSAAANEAAKNLGRLKADQEAMRGRLDEANQKYREATEQVSTLKLQLAQLSKQEQARSAAADEATKNLTRLKADQEAMRGRQDEAAQKYREATGLVITLRQQLAQGEAMQQGAEKAGVQASAQLAEAQRSFQEERKVLQQQLAQLSQEGQEKTVTVHEGEKKLIRLETELEARSRLEEANQKYQVATDQVSRLTQQAKQEEAVRKTAEQALQAAEKKLTGLDTELAVVRTRLEEANQKYKAVTEQAAVVKQRVTEEEAARKTAEQALVQATIQLEQAHVRQDEERATLQQQIARLREEGQAKTVAAHEAEKQLIRLEAELEVVRGRLEEANQQYRGATEQVNTLKTRVTHEETANLAKSNEVIRLTEQVNQTREQLAAEKKNREIEHADLSRQFAEQTKLAQESEKELLRAEASEELLKAQLAAVMGECRQATEGFPQAKDKLEKERVERVAKQEEIAHLKAQLNTSKAETIRYQQNTIDLERRRQEIIHRNEELKRKLATLQREREADEVMARAVFHLYEELSSKERRVESAAKLAEEKALRVQRHLSYRVGKSIVTNLTSPQRWLAMPLDIWSSYRQFQRDKSAQSIQRPIPTEQINFDSATRKAVLSLTSHSQSGSVALTAEPRELWIKPYSLVASAAIEIEWEVSCPNIRPLGGTLSLKAGHLARVTVLPSGVGDVATISIKKLAGKPCILEMDLRSEQNAAAPIEGAKTGIQLPDVQTVEYKSIPYMQRQKLLNSAADQVFDGKPLISVIMTTYNTIDLIDAAVKSILNQTWSNLELIIVDDCSTDGTRESVERYAQTDSRVRVFCFGENRGTYWCKNYGITLAVGVVMTFMDSDDISHETRLEEQFAELNKKGRVMVTCNMIRKDVAGTLIAINGAIERIAPISKMIKRRVIEEIGYFDTIRTSADDEFMQRLKLVYGKQAHFNVPKVLYTALVREQSLTCDPENAINLSASRDSKAFLSQQRAHYYESYVGWHKELVSKGMLPYMPFPVVNRPFPVHGKLLVKGDRYEGNAVSACLASFPPRKEQMKKTVQSIIDRVDAIYVYLNEYLEVPDFLNHPRIHVTLGVNSKGDLRDNGKFYFAEHLPRGYCFTIDDDIDYSSDYFEALIRKIEFYERKAVIGVHGTIFAKPIESYFKDRKLYHFRDELRRDAVVNQLGTGTVGFHTDLWRPSLEWFMKKGMADIYFAIEAKRRNITLIAIERQRGWLKPQNMAEGERRNLFDEFRSNDVVQTDLIRKCEPFDEVVRGNLASHLAQRIRFGNPFLSKAVAFERTDNVDPSGNSLPDRSRAA